MAMAPPLTLRNDFNAETLRDLAKRCRDGRQARRFLALAAVYDGMNRQDAARIGGMDRQTLRDWVVRFNQEGPDGLADRHRSGRRCRLSEAQLAELDEIVCDGPDPVVHGVVRWRRSDLKSVIKKRFGVDYSERGVGGLLKRLSFSHISGRPQHPAQDPQVIEDFKKTSRLSSKPT
jgi:transposase